MLSSRIIHVAGIGPVTFRRSSRAKHVNISLRPFSGVKVSVPWRVSFKRAHFLVKKKEAWILEHLAYNRRIEAEYQKKMGRNSEIDINAARVFLTQRIAFLATHHGFLYNKISIRSQRTRWGSCSVKNNISLNASLLLLPEELRDYVILHELVHTRIKNHSAVFWTELEKYVGPDIKKMRRRLKHFPVPA